MKNVPQTGARLATGSQNQRITTGMKVTSLLLINFIINL